MIVKVEQILEDTFNNIKPIDGVDYLSYGYGDEKDLDVILLTKSANKQRAYPLLWYMMPNSIEVVDGYAKGRFQFLLAHNTRLDWKNDQRFKESYDKVLFPWLEGVLDAFSRSHQITVKDGYKATNYPNYSKSLKKTKQVDYWDAIKLEIDLMVINKNNC